MAPWKLDRTLIVVPAIACAVWLLLAARNHPVQRGIEACEEAKSLAYRRQLLRYDDKEADAGKGELYGECAFRLTYSAARSAFREAAAKAGLILQTIPITGDNNEYTTDIATLQGDPDKVLLHISGIHGPEGFAGSAAQVAALHYLSLRNTTRRAMYESEGIGMQRPPTVVFVHALNPFGMAHDRRVNEDNVDINRNFLTDEQLRMTAARDPNFAGYVDVEFLLNPTSQLFPGWLLVLNDAHGLLKTAYAAVVIGVGRLKRSLVAGNYYKQQGLGFGGFVRSASVNALIALSREMRLSEARQVVLVDVHTGLGPPGTDTLVYFGHDDAAKMAEMERVFPLERNHSQNKVLGGMKEGSSGQGGGGAMAGYDLTIGTSDDFCRQWLSPTVPPTRKDVQRLCVTQEFGTVDVLTVGKALMDENYAFHHGSGQDRAVYGQRLKAAFFVQTNAWARAVAHRGLSVVLQAFDELCSTKPLVV